MSTPVDEYWLMQNGSLTRQLYLGQATVIGHWLCALLLMTL